MRLTPLDNIYIILSVHLLQKNLESLNTMKQNLSNVNGLLPKSFIFR